MEDVCVVVAYGYLLVQAVEEEGVFNGEGE